jgi:uncharacterized repeat protein (TIGR02543 family)
MKKIMIIVTLLISLFVFDLGTQAAFSDPVDIGTTSFVTGKEVFYVDFDLDGDMDFLIQSSTSVSLNINNGLGVFTETQLEFDVYQSITVIDYNGDLYPDLFVNTLVGNDSVIYFYENDQEGGFLERVEMLKLVSPSLPSYFKWIDLDSDGKLDLVFNNLGKLYVIYGSENPLDAEAAVLISGTISNLGTLIEFHDFNKDGQIDIIFNRGTLIYSIMSNEDRSYLAPVILASNAFTLDDIGLHDMNNDGVLDVIYSADKYMKYYIYGQNGFLAAQDIYVFSSKVEKVIGIQSVDMNNDGMNDLVYLANDTLENNLELRIHYQLKSGTELIHSEEKEYSRNVTAVAYFDVDNNGFKDVVIVQLSKISVLKNEISGTEITFDTNGGKPLDIQVLSSQQFNVFDKFTFTGIQPYDYKLVDLNGDGYLDLIYSGFHLKDGFRFLAYRLGTGLFTFGDAVYIENDFPFVTSNKIHIEIGDVDKDNHLDIVIYAARDSNGPLLAVFKHDGNMNFTRYNITPHTTFSDRSELIKLGDVTGDGYLDIIYQSINTTKLFVYVNTFVTDQDFTNVIEASTSFNIILDIEVADFNNDDKNEIIVADYTGKKIGILSKNENNTFSEILIANTNNYGSISATDFDGDGDIDIISVSYDGKVEYFQNNSTTTLSFAGASVLYDGNDNSSGGVLSGDLDLDGDSDLLVISDSFNFRSFIYMNNNKTLSAPIKFYDSNTLYFPKRADLMDVNGDGVLDIVSFVVINNDFRLYVFNQVNSYKNIALPTPEREEAEFLGWYYDAELNDAYDPTQMITEDMTLYAKWKRLNTELIIKDASGIVYQQKFTEGQSLTSVSLPQPTPKEGYTFVNWSLAIPLTMGTEDIEINAIYEATKYSITFNSNGGSAVSIINQDFESAVSAPLNPTREGYTFDGWFSNEELTEAFVFNTMPLNGKTLYAKWTPNTYTIELNTNGSPTLNPITKVYDEDINIPKPSRVGYTFNGWFEDNQTFLVPFTETTMKSSKTLYAKWTLNTFNITYTLNGGDNNALNVSTYSIETNTVNLLAPTKVGHTFIGWFENSAFTGTPVTSIQSNRLENVSVFAKFDINTYTISFDTRGGSTIEPISLDFGSSVPTVNQPTREGYTFNKFNIDIPQTMPAENFTITASWALIAVVKDEALKVEVDGLFEAIPEELKTEDDLSVSLIVELNDEEELNENQILIKSQLTSNQQFQFLDIYVLLTRNQVDVRVSELTQVITISLVLPEDIQGFRGYQVVSVHNGVYRELETQFDDTTQTITFITDKFSSYAIVYNVNTSRDLLIYIILAIAIFFMIIVFKRKKKNEEEKPIVKPVPVVAKKEPIVKPALVKTQKEPEALEAVLKVDAIVIPSVTSRTKYLGGSKVEKGYYLEVTKDFDSTNRIIELDEDELPNVLTTGNAFIKISQAEVGLLSLKGISAFGLLKKTPGSKGDKGYYGEVDLLNIFTGRTIILVEKLPPTSKKGFRWVRVQTRVIK